MKIFIISKDADFITRISGLCEGHEITIEYPRVEAVPLGPVDIFIAQWEKGIVEIMSDIRPPAKVVALFGDGDNITVADTNALTEYFGDRGRIVFSPFYPRDLQELFDQARAVAPYFLRR